MRGNRIPNSRFHRMPRIGAVYESGKPLERDTSYISPETVKNLKSSEFGKKNVLVGTVAGSEQYEANLSRRFYYVPLSKMPENYKNVKYIAISTPRSLGESNIRYYAKIKSIKTVKRNKIPVPTRRNNPDEPYCYFTLEEWEHLPVAINPLSDSIGAPRLTNMFLLKNCRYYYELFSIETAAQYVLYVNLCRILNDISINGNESAEEPDFPLGKRYRIKLREGVLLVTDRKNTVDFAAPISDFQMFPIRILQQLSRYI